MDEIRIEGADPRTLPREPHDLQRRTAGVPFAVCHAPFVSLAVDREGRVTACRHSSAVLGHLREQTLAGIWRSERTRTMRDRFRAYRVEREACRPCVELWEEGLHAASPALAEFDAAAPAQSEDPTAPLWLALDAEAPLDEAQRASLRAWLPAVRCLEVAVGSVAAEAAAASWLDAVTMLPCGGRPRVRLRVQGFVPKLHASHWPVVEAVTIALDMEHVALPSDAARGLSALAEEARALGVLVAVRVPLHSRNWIHLWSWQDQLATNGVRILPELVPAGRDGSLAELGGQELAALRTVVARWSVRGGAGRAEPGFHRLLQRLRTWQATAPARNAAAELTLPDLEHPLLQDQEEAAQLLRDLLRIYRSPSVERWLTRLVATNGFARAARERRALRLAALWLACVFRRQDEGGTSAAEDVLRQVYQTAQGARQITQDDLEALAGSSWEPWLRGWVQELRLMAPLRTSQPFPITHHVTGRRSHSPKVTVIVPSYNHEAYVGKALESVLGQTCTDFRLLVVDDHSTDGTVEQARRLDDPRLSVRRNPRNLGLGPSLHAALRAARTPYVAILNSDDVYAPDRLERCLDALEAHGDAQVVGTGVVPIDASDRTCSADDASPLFDGRRMYEWLQWHATGRPPPSESRALLNALLERNFLLTSSNLFARRGFLIRHAASWKRLEFCIDWQIFLLAALDDQLIHLPAPLLGYRLHGANTVWFHDQQRWRMYLEASRVAAHTLERLFSAQSRRAAPDPLGRVAAAVAGPIAANTSVDAAGILIAHYADRKRAPACSLDGDALAAPLQRLDASQAWSRRAVEGLSSLGGDLAELHHLRGERAFLDAVRVSQEALSDHVVELRRELDGATHELRDARERLGDAEGVAAELAAERGSRSRLERELEEARRRHRDELEHAGRRHRDELERAHQARQRAEEAGRALGVRARAEQERALAEQRESEERSRRLAAWLAASQAAVQDLDARLRQRGAELGALERSAAYRVGDLLLNRMRLRTPIERVERLRAAATHRLTLRRLAMERWRSTSRGGGLRAMATICWNFPIYSQTFVHQELTELARCGFDLRIVYSWPETRANLHGQFDSLWKLRRRLVLDRSVHEADLAYFLRKLPHEVEQITSMLVEASGRSRAYVVDHANYLQAFSYARMVEAYRPDYLHSYFFYDRSLFALVAGHLLGVPRGISCYADHVLDDYEFKVVPLHMRLCDVVVATSARIKRELLERAGDVDERKILIKPNAVDCRAFARVERREPVPGEPYRVACVGRIEPKKGMFHLLDAAARLRERGLRLEVHIVGEADERNYHDRFVQRIDELQLRDSVHLEGRCDLSEVRRFLAMAQLFVAPFVETPSGDKDGIPTALLEAMATGLPVVVTDAGSILEVVEDGVDGLIVPQRDADALADALESLLGDPERRAQMATRAAEKVRRRFDAAAEESRFHERVLQLLEARRRA